MWVAESARGLGVGRRMLARLEACARDNGAAIAHIETNGTLVEAISLYLSAGYVEVPPFNDEPFADHWLERQLADAGSAALSGSSRSDDATFAADDELGSDEPDPTTARQAGPLH